MHRTETASFVGTVDETLTISLAENDREDDGEIYDPDNKKVGELDGSEKLMYSTERSR